MTGSPERGRVWNRTATAVACILVIAGIAHRWAIFARYRQDVAALLERVPEPFLLTYQHLGVTALRDHFWQSMLYLQQTPPIPNVLLAAVLKLTEWPLGTTKVLIGFQAGLSIVASLLLFELLARTIERLWLRAIVAGLFLLSSGVVVLEYHYFGQLYYESLAMVLVLLVVRAFFAFVQGPTSKQALVLGLSVAALALTRSAYAYFFVVPPVFLFIAARNRRIVLIAIFLAAALVPQIAWSTKNHFVYGTFRLSTSTWVGTNFAAGLRKAGLWPGFRTHILAESDRYPSWFVGLVRRRKWPFFFRNLDPRDFPSYVRERDEQIQKRLAGTNPIPNTVAERVLADAYGRAVASYFVDNPLVALRKWARSYAVFWQPIYDYGRISLNPLSPASGPPFLTSTFLSTPIRLLNLITLHLVVPVLCLLTVLRRRSVVSAWTPELAFLLAVYAYAAFTFNLAEHGENMRFRLSVEPVIWLITAFVLRGVAEHVGYRKRRLADVKQRLPTGRTR